MGLSIYRIKKWIKMLSGKSILHVDQSIGKYFNPAEISGYYNNLTEKVLKMPLKTEELPVMELETASGESRKVVFSIAVMQYGLGAYDLYLASSDPEMLSHAIACADWAVDNQAPNGGWITFDFCYPDAPYSAMSTGEGISLLARAYMATKDIKYLNAAEKAYRFMLIPISEGGVSKIKDEKLFLYEYTDKSPVLNGAIFSFWGLWDYALLTGDEEAQRYSRMAEKAISEMLPRYDYKFWSLYDDAGKIASPFYHNLHIAQLEAMFALTGNQEYQKYLDKWRKYNSNPLNKARAFAIKAIQKIRE